MELQLFPAAEVATEPLEVGETSRLSLVDIVDRRQGAPFSAGLCEVFPGDPVAFDYDNDAAVCFMLDGEISLSEGEERRSFRPGDTVYIPKKQGLLVNWSTDSYGRFFYVTYPHWR